MNSPLDLSPGAAAPDDLAHADNDSAPAANGDALPPLIPPAEAPTPLAESGPQLAYPAPPTSPDFPVASVLPPLAPLLPPAATTSLLEDRLRRLEAELAQLRAQGPPAPVADAPDSPQPATGIVRQRGRFWDGLGKRLLAPSGPAARGASRPSVAHDLVPPGVRRSWMLWEALTELRAMYWMFFDPRYHLSWFGRLAPLGLIAMIVGSWLWVPFSGVMGVGWIPVKIADVVLAYVLFKVLSYEARRYRETAPDLPPSMRL